MPTAPALPTISPLVLGYLRGVARRYFRKHFRSVMVQQSENLRGARGPLIVYANHSSWWDPLLMILLAKAVLPEREHYAPMDANALARYPIFRRLGIFPVELATVRGAAKFVQTSTAILESGGVLWLTPQGRFADPRERPLAFRPGLGLLAARLPHVALLPMALEYTFWNERLPETLIRLGPPRHLPAGTATDAATEQLEAALLAEMEALQQASVARDATAFEPLLRGTRGMGGVYGWFRHARAWFRRERFEQDHTTRS